MNSRERLQRIFNFKIPDRVGIQDSYWNETILRWIKEGLPEGLDLGEYFDHDFAYINFNQSLLYPEEKIAEDEETITVRTSYGTVERRWKVKDGPPQILEPALRDPRKPDEVFNRLKPSQDRIPKSLLDHYNQKRNKGRFITFSALDPYENSWRIVGVTELLTYMLDEPDFVYALFQAQADLIIESAKMMMDMGIKFDCAWFWGDIAYRSGPLFSPDCYRRLLKPAHERIFSFFRNQDIPVVYHTDGDIRPLIPDLIDAGISALQPLEAKAGLDVRELRAAYPNLVLIGNIDIRRLGTREEIEDEVRTKILAVKDASGYIYHSDHSIPPSVSLENYKFLLECVKGYGAYEK